METPVLCRMNREVSAMEFRKPEVSKNCLSLLYQALGAYLMLVICSSPVAYTLSLYVYIHEAFIILSCYLNCGLT